MAVDRYLWSAGLGKGYAPSTALPVLSEWHAAADSPICCAGAKRQSSTRHSNEDLDFFYIDYAFSASLECERCHEENSMLWQGWSGTGHVSWRLGTRV